MNTQSGGGEPFELSTWQVEEVSDGGRTLQPEQLQRPVEPGQSPREPRRRGGLGIAAMVTLGVVALAGVAGAGFLYGSRTGGDDVATLLGEPADADPAAAGSGSEADDDTGNDEVADDEVVDGEVADGEVADGEVAADESAAGDAGTETESQETDGSDNAEEPDADRAPPSPRPDGMNFLADGVDQAGRPLPALPRFLAANTKDPEQLASYHPDPERVPTTGPYMVVKGGFFFLRGSMASENLRQELIRRNLLVMSRDNLLIEVEIDGSDEWYLDQPIPLFFEDAVLFDVGQSELQLDTLKVFLRFSQLIELAPEVTLEIIGHTDNVGDEASNLALSEERVAIVKDAFVQLGAPEGQIGTIAKGESEPVASNNTAAGRAANRRVEFAITYPAGQPLAG